MDSILKELPVYRCLLILILLFFGTGVCISYFRTYRVNYVYIFGIMPIHKLNQYQMYKMFLFLLTLWSFGAVIEVLSVK